MLSYSCVARNDYSNDTVIAYAISNLDLAVYVPNSSVINYSFTTTTQNNVAIVEFTPQVGGTYTIRIYTTLATAIGKNTYFRVHDVFNDYNGGIK